MIKLIALVLVFIAYTYIGDLIETKAKQNYMMSEAENPESKIGKQYMEFLKVLREHAKGIVVYSNLVVEGDIESFEKLRRARNFGEMALHNLRDGNRVSSPGQVAQGVPPMPDYLGVGLDKTQKLYEDAARSVDVILMAEGTLRMTSEFRKTLKEIMPELSAEINNIVKNLPEKTEADRIQKENITSQIPESFLSIEKMNKILAEGRPVDLDVDTLSNDTRQFAGVVLGMVKGNFEMSIKRVNNSKLRPSLDKISELFETFKGLVYRIRDMKQTLADVKTAVSQLPKQSSLVTDSVTAVMNNYLHQAAEKRSKSG